MYHWSWEIVVYLFLGGLGAGAYLVSYGAERGIFGNSIFLKRIGYYLSTPSIMIGCMLLFLDLGIAFSEPLGVVRMLSNFTSVMTWGIYILSLFIVIGIITAIFTYKNKEIPIIISSIGAILAFATACYTGVLLMVVMGIPFWNTYAIPGLFVVSALSTGMAACSLLSHFFIKTEFVEDKNFELVHIILVCAELLLIAALLVPALNGINGTAATQSAQIILKGRLALPFWLLCIGGGLILPIVRYFLPKLIFSDKVGHIVSETAILIGGLTVRAVVIFSAVRAWL